MAAPRKKSDRLSWYKQDAGGFVAETAGLSLRHMGAYATLKSLYWLLGNRLPSDRAILMRKMFAFTPEDVTTIEEVLAEFFPLDDEGQHCHLLLDEQLAEVQNESVAKKAAADKRWEGSRTVSPTSAPKATPDDAEDSADF